MIVHPDGKQALADLGNGPPGPMVRDLTERGSRVLLIDPFQIGEALSAFGERGQDLARFSTYNQEDAACRVQDIVTSLAYLGTREDVSKIHLLGIKEAGIWCLLGRAIAGRADAMQMGRIAVDFSKARVSDDGYWEGKMYIPGVRAVGDVRTAPTLIAPGTLLIHNVGRDFPRAWVRDAYRAAGKLDRLCLSPRRWRWQTTCVWLLDGTA